MNSTSYFKSGCWIIAIPMILIFIGIASGAISDDLGTIFLLLSIIAFAVLIAIIFWVVGTAKAVKETYVFVRDSLIDLFTIKREIKQKCPEALRAIILEKQKHAVKVGIFDSNNVICEKLNISGNGVVNDELFQGQTIKL